MPYCIVHKATRVVRRLTIDPNHPLAADEESVQIDGKVDIGGGPWKVDSSGNLVPATLAEYRAAGLDEAYNVAQRAQKVQALRAALDDVLANELLPTRMRTMMQRFRELLD